MCVWSGGALVAVAAALALLAPPCADAATPFTIGVVDGEPETTLVLGAAVSAALGADASAVEPVEPEEPLAVARAVCALAARGAAAVVAGGARRAARLAADAAARAGVPLLAVGEAPLAAGWEALALRPDRALLAAAAADLARAKGWPRAVLLHEESAADAALLAPDTHRIHLLARQLPPIEEDTLLRNLLLVLKKMGENKFIVWCGSEMAIRVLDAAQRVGLLAERHAYLLLTLDAQVHDLAPYSHGGANVTTLRLYDPGAPGPRRLLRRWRDAYEGLLDKDEEEGDPEDADEAEGEEVSPPPSSLPLAYRAAKLVAAALDALALPPAAPPDCATAHGAFHADTLLNYLRSEEWEGEESGGPISWEAGGARRSVELEVVELGRGGLLRRVAAWAPHAGLVWQRDDPPAPPPPPDSMTNRTFNILIAVNEPYVMRKQSANRLSGNTRYEGFCIDLIERLAAILQFNYNFIEQKDGRYGMLDNKTGKWNGMLGRLMEDQEVHFAITDLTITAERERVVDFTTPFMNLGISILFRKPDTPKPDLFSFLMPFSNGVWLCLGLAYVGTSLLLFVVGRLCHEEWQNPYPCVEEPAALENQFTLGNALWFNLGAVLLQGSEVAPVAYGTRAVAGSWWIFALVITSSYTANLATLLAKKSATNLIQSVEDLANGSIPIDYGAKLGGSTYTFFEHSQNALYQKMYEHMKNHKMPGSNEEGIAKVQNKDGYYAFLMESTTIEYVIERKCTVTKIGGLLDSKGYGIAMRKDSAYRQSMNLALLNLQEAGVLREMKDTWWNKMHGGGACKATEEHESEELEMDNLLGLFLVLAVGCAVGVAVSCVDLAAAAWRRARADREPFARRLAAELRFVFRFEQSVKPLQGPLSESSSGSEGGEGAEGSLLGRGSGSGGGGEGGEEAGEAEGCGRGGGGGGGGGVVGGVGVGLRARGLAARVVAPAPLLHARGQPASRATHGA